MPPNVSIHFLLAMAAAMEVAYGSTGRRLPAHALHLLHALSCKMGVAGNASLGSYLILILLDAGKLCLARSLFDRLLHPNNKAWNALVIAYVQSGKLKLALDLYHQMQEHSIPAFVFTFIALLKSCAKLKDLARGRDIHKDAERMGLVERDLFLGNTVIDMYAKCGFLSEAERVFDKLPIRDVVSWTTLGVGYVNHKHYSKALNYFKQMQFEGVPPNAVTFVFILKSCGRLGALNMGLATHMEIDRKGIPVKDLMVGNALIDMYAEFGLLGQAQEAFDKLPTRDIVSWTALIASYVKNMRSAEALHKFEQMQLEGVFPDSVTFVYGTVACAARGSKGKGKQMHVEIVWKGLLERDLILGNALIDMYAKFGMVAEAREVFDRLPVRDVISWNVLMAAYTKAKCDEEALNCFEEMKSEQLPPDVGTFIYALKACGSIRDNDKGKEIHDEISRRNLLEKDLVVGNALIDMYAKCNLLSKAQEVLRKLPARDTVSWNVLISGYVEQYHNEEALKCFEMMQLEGFSPDTVTFICCMKACSNMRDIDKGREIHADIARQGSIATHATIGNALIDMYGKCGWISKAQEVFDKLTVRDVVSWTALITGYTEHECCREALACFEQMQTDGVFPNSVTLICCLKACSVIGAIDKGRELHAEAARTEMLRSELVVGNAVVDMYAKCGFSVKAEEVFHELPMKDVISWNALITGYAQLGEIESVLSIIERMEREGERPNFVTFLCLLTACNHAGLVNKAPAYFNIMMQYYGIHPTQEHYICMVELLGRAGQLDSVVTMIEKTPFRPNLTMWCNVLDACRKWGNVVLGRAAFEHAM